MTDDELIVTPEAVDAIAGAYEQAANDFRSLADHFWQIYSGRPWGELNSIQQLQKGYEDLAIGSSGSAVNKMREYADHADSFSGWIRANAESILYADEHSAASLFTSEQT